MTTDGRRFKRQSNQYKRRKTADTGLPNSVLSGSFQSLLKTTIDVSRETRASWDEVGITEFVLDGLGVAAYTKQRFSDFIVNEIDQNGAVVRLTSCSNPNPIESNEDPLDDEQILSQLKDAVTDYDGLIEFLRSDSKELVLINYPDKSQRSLMHSLLKRYQSIKLFSQTVCDGGRKDIRIYKDRAPLGDQFQGRKFSGGESQYLQMALYKENVETMKAVNALAEIVRIPVGRFSYAGNKDRRGITTQLITAFKLDATNLIKALPRLRPDVRVGNLQYVNDPLRLGSLSGNRFGVVLRDVQYPEGYSDENLLCSLKSASERGFVNYFGLQRFGTGTVSTHRVGQAIMQNQFDLAVALILTPQPTQSAELRAALQSLTETASINETLPLLGKRDFVERTVLQYLCRFPTNYSNALDHLPRNMKILYVHAYQSWIWNLMASYRLNHFDKERPVIGDLVMDPSDPDGNRVIILEEGDLPRYSIFDVVLPLPGYSIILPNHDVGRFCLEMLASHQLSLEKLNHRVRDYKLSGAYRPVLVRPSEMQWDLYRYDDVSIPLLQSDAEIMDGVEQPKSVPNGDKLALCLRFSLPASAYATMLIREVVKGEPLNWFALNIPSSKDLSGIEETQVMAADEADIDCYNDAA